MKILIGSREYEMPTTLVAEAGTKFAEELAAQNAAIGRVAATTHGQACAYLDGPLKYFIGDLQRRTLKSNFRGEEKQYFFDLMRELAERIATMPQTYDQDGKGELAIATLHYFAGGSANWWITEKDKGCEDDGKHGNPENSQQQAFGLADLFRDGGELGYISIAEILAKNGELDFHFTPKTLREVRADNDR